MTFQRKLFLGFCIMIVPIALIGAEALWTNRAERQALRALGESMARTQAFEELETTLFRQGRRVFPYLTGMDRDGKAEFFQLEEQINQKLREWKAALEPEEVNLARDIEQLHAQIFTAGKQVFALYESGKRFEAFLVADRELQKRLLPALSVKVRTVHAAARTYRLEKAYARLEEILRTEQRVLYSIIGLSLLIGMAASGLISRSLAWPIRELKAAMEVVGQGRLDHPITIRSNDEIGSLAQAFAAMKENLKRSHQAMAQLNDDLETQIKKLKDTQAQLIQSEKLASIGEMSAAVAHGLRNPLASLRAAAQVALRQVKGTPATEEHLKSVIAEVDRLDRRIGHLLSFSRPAPFRPLPEQLPRLVEALLPTFTRQFQDRGIRVETDLPNDLPEVQVDPIQLEQALVEILSNALDAMPTGGRLAIRGYSEPDDGKVGRVVIEISDTGDGIPDQVLPSVCDPFFTTRAEGTGLGLAIAKRYVAQNGGTLDIASTQGAGTTVRICLPPVLTPDSFKAAVGQE
ncbi:MAG: ATP-binding protein [Acidobacteria bacterium]|nr:ATP-binding protein [Acidobacteriota bacterium]